MKNLSRTESISGKKKETGWQKGLILNVSYKFKKYRRKFQIYIWIIFKWGNYVEGKTTIEAN